MKLSQIVNFDEQDVKKLAVPYGDFVINIEYSRSRYTPKFEKELKEKTDEGLPAASLSLFLISLLRKWDIVDDKGNPVPLTVEALEEIPTTFQSRLVEAIAEDQRPNQKPSETTSGSF